MKEAKLIEMANKINKLEETMSLVISDLRNINSLAVGTLETIKRMPDYQEALDKLKEEAAKADEPKKDEGQKD
jgi:predicted transcriptional regulator